MSDKLLLYDTVVVGAGPAGLFCALKSVETGMKTLIIEKNRQAGRKLLISGLGKCNITHKGDIIDFITHYGEKSRFVKPALLNFDNQDLIEYFESRGLKFAEAKGGKIFPESLKSTDILNILLNECNVSGIEILYNERAEDITCVNGEFEIKTANNIIYSKNIVIATGGKSYSQTGSTGDGYKLAENLGHTIVPVYPCLTPVIIKDYKFADVSGVSISSARISLYRNSKKIKSSVGDILFTHTGLSGPGILDFSRYFYPSDELKIQLISDEEKNALDSELIAGSAAQGKKTVKNRLAQYKIPESLINKLFDAYDIPVNLTLAEMDKAARKKIVSAITETLFVIERLGDYDEAMATRGGVNTEEINPKTMESRITPNLYFAGETMDVDGDTGGYNLQFAFSSGALAGKSIASKSKEGTINENNN